MTFCDQNMYFPHPQIFAHALLSILPLGKDWRRYHFVGDCGSVAAGVKARIVMIEAAGSATVADVSEADCSQAPGDGATLSLCLTFAA